MSPADVTRAPRIEVHETEDALATAIAGELLLRLSDVQAAGREPQIALTGGTIADAVHRELARVRGDHLVLTLPGRLLADAVIRDLLD